jgi:hypothetical protein
MWLRGGSSSLSILIQTHLDYCWWSFFEQFKQSSQDPQIDWENRFLPSSGVSFQLIINAAVSILDGFTGRSARRKDCVATSNRESWSNRESRPNLPLEPSHELQR